MDNSDLMDNEIRSIVVLAGGPSLPSATEKGTGSISATLIDPDGNSLANTAVEICVETINLFYSGSTPCSGQPFIIQSETDAQGNFTITDLPVGYYVITAAVGNEWANITGELGISSLRVLVEAGEEGNLGEITISK
jgi:hypothetical protein